MILHDAELQKASHTSSSEAFEVINPIAGSSLDSRDNTMKTGADDQKKSSPNEDEQSTNETIQSEQTDI